MALFRFITFLFLLWMAPAAVPGVGSEIHSTSLVLTWDLGLWLEHTISVTWSYAL